MRYGSDARNGLKKLTDNKRSVPLLSMSLIITKEYSIARQCQMHMHHYVDNAAADRCQLLPHRYAIFFSINKHES